MHIREQQNRIGHSTNKVLSVHDDRTLNDEERLVLCIMQCMLITTYYYSIKKTRRRTFRREYLKH